MKKQKIILIIAILLFIIPFLGFPSAYQDIIISAFGLIIIAILTFGDVLYHKIFKNSHTNLAEKNEENIQNNTPEFLESEPESDFEVQENFESREEKETESEQFYEQNDDENQRENDQEFVQKIDSEEESESEKIN